MIPELLEILGIVSPLSTVAELGLVILVGKYVYDIANKFFEKK